MGVPSAAVFCKDDPQWQHGNFRAPHICIGSHIEGNAHEHRPIASHEAHSVRHGSPRRPSRRRRHRHADGNLEAQHSIPARRLPLFLLRLHGCNRDQSLSARARLSQGQARERRLHRIPAGAFRARAGKILDPGRENHVLRVCRCDAARPRARQSARRPSATDRRRGLVPAGGCGRGPASKPRQLRDRRCAVSAGPSSIA